MPLRETLEAIRNGPTPGNEESAKMWILSPVLQDLGWRPYDVQWEYQVGRGKGRVDAALTGPKGAAAFIEAKAPGSRLDDHVEQVLRYAFQEGVNICALTTGLEWWLYLPAERGYQFDDRRFAELRLKDDPVEQLATDFAAFLSKETLLGGEAEKKAKQVLKARRDAEQVDKEVPGIWREMLATPDEELIELVSKRVYEKTNLRPTPHQVTTVLTGRSTPPTINQPQPINTPTNPEVNQHNLSNPSRSYSKIPQSIDLFGQNYEIKYWADIIRIVVDYLFEQGADFNKALDMSGITLTIPPGYKKDFYEVDSTGIYVYKSRGSNAENHARKLLERFSYRADELVLYYSPRDAQHNLQVRTKEKDKEKSDPPIKSDGKTKEKAIGFDFVGKYYEVKYNYLVLVGVAEVLFERHGSDFKERAVDLNGIVLLRETHTPRNFCEIGSSGIAVRRPDANFWVRSYQLIEHFGYKSNDLRIDTTKGSIDYSTLDIHKSKKSPTKPVGIVLFGKYYKIKLWNEVIKHVADVLYERHRFDLDRALKFRTFASRTPDAFKSAYEVGDSGIFISTALNSQNYQIGSKKLLEEFGYHSTELEILFEEKGSK